MQALELIQDKKKNIKNIMEVINNTNDKEKKLKLYKDILKIDNTDRQTVYEYLILIKQMTEGTFKNEEPLKEIITYIHHFPLEQYNKEFIGFNEKKNSSIEKILLILNKILSKEWIKSTLEEREDAIKFFLKAIEDDKFELKNTSPITWENDELYIFNLYLVLITQIHLKMEYYISLDNINEMELKSENIIKYDKLIKKYEDELKVKNCSEKSIDNSKKLIEKYKLLKEYYLLIEGNFFKKYLSKFSIFLQEIKDTYLKKLSTIKFVNEEDKNIFEYFMLFISYYNFESISRDICSVWKCSFDNSYNEINMKLVEYYRQKYPLMKIIIENNNKLILKIKYINDIIIENYNDYELDSLLDDIYKNLNFNEIKAIKYVKIPKLNNHLYIKKIYKNWRAFNLSIFNSKTIKSLYKTLFKEQYSFIEGEKELDIILKNITFYSFDTDFSAITDRKALKIYEYSNYENLVEIYDKYLLNEDVLKVIFLAFNLIINFHEILGHLNIKYQIYKYGQEKKEYYNSPKVNKNLSSDYAKGRDDRESGEDIEIKLFGRVILDLSLKEALFILNLTNYLVNDYNSFKNKFIKCDNEKINIDESFSDLLYKSFNINTNKILFAENKRYSFDDLIKKSINNRKLYPMKRKHPIGYNIDGMKKEDYDKVKKRLEIINSLEDIQNNKKN